MDFATFEARVLELMFKTDARITPPLVAYRVGCSVDVARQFLEAMAREGSISMEVDEKGTVHYDVPGRPASTNEPLSWMPAAPPGLVAHGQPAPAHLVPSAYGAQQVAFAHPQGPGPVQVQIHNAAPASARVIVLGQPKSIAIAVLAALFLGPLGMLYATVGGAIIMFIVNVLVIGLSAGAGLVITLPLGAMWAAAAASQHNERLTRAVG
jgi:hypothetical protein